MRNHRRLLIVLACTAALVGTIAFFSRDDAPRSQGRSVAKWLMTYYESDRPNHHPQGPAAATALRAIGTNALPCLLAWIRYEAPPWHRNIARVMPGRIGNSRPARATLYRGHHRAAAAQKGFQLLGTNAVGAIPELSRMARDQSQPQTAKRAIEILSGLGPEAFPVMEAALADTHRPFRESIAVCLAVNTVRHVGTNACLSPLREAMNDPDPALRAAASRMVTRLTGSQGPGTPAR